MVTGASTADLAIILIDARKGVLTQTRRHAYLAALMGIRHVVLAVNKMDLVGWSQAMFDAHRQRLSALSPSDIGLQRHRRHPDLGAQRRQHRLAQRARPGTTARRCSTHLEDGRDRRRRAPHSRCACRCNGSTARTPTSAASPARSPAARQARRPHCVSRPPAKRPRSRASSPRTAISPQRRRRPIRDADARRRTRLLARRRHRRRRSAAGESPISSKRLLIWMADEPLLPGRPYSLKIGAKTVAATVTELKHKIEREHAGARRGQAAGAERDRRRAMSASIEPIAFDPYARKPRHGRLHPDRPRDQRDGRRRPHPLRAAPRAERALAGARRDPRRARGAEAPEAGGALVHRPLRRRQIHHRQPGREEAPRARTPHRPARWRQRPPRPQPRSGLHRRRPRRKHPPRRRSGEADGRCRPHRARLVHLAVPRRARAWRAT